MTKDNDNGGEWPKRVGVMTLFVDDLAATSIFYQEVFGLPVVFGDDD